MLNCPPAENVFRAFCPNPARAICKTKGKKMSVEKF